MVCEVVRNQAERARMPAHFCVECNAFFEAAGYVGQHAAAGRSLHGYCSRHRAVHERRDTPNSFWGWSQ